MKITNKTIKTVKTTFVWAFKIQDLLYVISLRGLGVKVNAKNSIQNITLARATP